MYDQERLYCFIQFQYTLTLSCSWKHIHFPAHHSHRNSHATSRSRTCPSTQLAPAALLRAGQTDPRPGQAKIHRSLVTRPSSSPRGHPLCWCLVAFMQACHWVTGDLGQITALIQNVQVNKFLAEHRTPKEIWYRDTTAYNRVYY